MQIHNSNKTDVLLDALLSDDMDTVEYLLDSEYEPSIDHVWAAAKTGKYHMISTLINLGDIEYDKSKVGGCTPFTEALWRDDVRTIKILLSYYKKEILSCGEDRKTMMKYKDVVKGSISNSMVGISLSGVFKKKTGSVDVETDCPITSKAVSRFKIRKESETSSLM